MGSWVIFEVCLYLKIFFFLRHYSSKTTVNRKVTFGIFYQRPASGYMLNVCPNILNEYENTK